MEISPGDDDVRGIVRPAVGLEHFRLDRWTPAPPLDRFVDRFWRTAWNLPEPFEQDVVTRPCVNIIFESTGSAIVGGVALGHFRRLLEGTGWAFSMMFRPGGFRPFIDGPVSKLTGRRLELTDVFGSDAEGLGEAVVSAADDEARRAILTDFFVPRCPDEPTIGEGLADLLAEAVSGDEPITRVGALAERHGVSTRTLQRLFSEHVGVGPKAILERARVHAVADVAGERSLSWADAAQRLGYADQAHLTADFSQAYGTPPARYARESAPSDRRP